MIDVQIHYRKLYARVPGKFSCRAHSAAELRDWQRAFRPALREALGLNRIAEDLAKHQPSAQRVTTQELDGYTREEWKLWVEPDVALPFYLLLPQRGNGPRPLVLCPHGHNHPHIYVGLHHDEDERKGMIEGERDIAVQAVREGYVVIAPTTRGFGETRTTADAAEQKLSSCRTQLLHGLLLGRTPIGERVWDIERLVDWASANLPIDPKRIAITGNSGGGTTSVFAAACDQRIAVSVPGSYFCTFAGSIGSIYHCDCNYVPGLLRLGEMWDIAGLIAPRPFCAVAGKEDAIFPISEVRIAFERLKQIYSVAGAAENCELYVGNGGHRFYKAGAWPFIRRYFVR